MNSQMPLKDDTISVHLSLMMTNSYYMNTQMPLKDDTISVHLSLTITVSLCWWLVCFNMHIYVSPLHTAAVRSPITSPYAT
jgi:hypothetical protein